jgi:integrase
MVDQATSLARAAGLTRRQRRRTLTDKQVAALPRKAKRYIMADPEQRGLYLRVPVSGPVTYAAVARHSGKQIWVTLGGTDVMSIDAAREKARDAIRRIRAGLEPFEAPPVKPDSVADVTEQWLKRHVTARGLRTADEIKRQLDVYVLPRVGQRPFAELRRGDIAHLLDAIEDKHGPWIADSVLGILRSVATWFASRNDDYQIPFVRGQRRVPSQDRKRSRILNDDELRAVWTTAEQSGSFGAFIRLSLLLAQRRQKLATMRWSDISPDGLWTIATAPREKGNPGVLKLPPQAMAIIKAQPRFAANPFVFPGRGSNEMRGFTALKDAFDKKSGVDGYSLHDLRRTARSLMSRGHVQTEIAERVLGHVRPGVEGTYDRHDYTDQKGLALRQLATLIATIVNPPADNVKQYGRRS